MKFSLGALALALVAITASAAPVADTANNEAHLQKRFSGGVATFYYQGGTAGACGSYNSDWSHVVALQSGLYNGGEFCGKTVGITNKSNGKVVYAQVADECPGCRDQSSLDLSRGAFNAIAEEYEGEVPIDWWFQ